MNLAQEADAFHDGIDLGADPDLARNGFAGVSVATKNLRDDLNANQAALTPRVQQAWRAYVAAEVLLRQALGLPNDAETLTGTALVAEGPSPVLAQADQLLAEVTAFLQVFGPTAGVVPQGGAFLADARQLHAAVSKFRDDAARGLDPGRLAYEFRSVDLVWQRTGAPGRPDRPRPDRAEHPADRQDGPAHRRDPPPSRHAGLPAGLRALDPLTDASRQFCRVGQRRPRRATHHPGGGLRVEDDADPPYEIVSLLAPAP